MEQGSKDSRMALRVTGLIVLLALLATLRQPSGPSGHARRRLPATAIAEHTRSRTAAVRASRR